MLQWYKCAWTSRGQKRKKEELNEWGAIDQPTRPDIMIRYFVVHLFGKDDSWCYFIWLSIEDYILCARLGNFLTRWHTVLMGLSKKVLSGTPPRELLILENWQFEFPNVKNAQPFAVRQTIDSSKLIHYITQRKSTHFHLCTPIT